MMIAVGHGNFLESGSVLVVVRPDSSPARRLRRSAAESGLLVDATSGRAARSLIVLSTGHVVLSSLTVDTFKSRFGKVLPKEGADPSLWIEP
jgi:regulator of extracellular matrix RemA (YlzA/DUF370 family)